MHSCLSNVGLVSGAANVKILETSDKDGITGQGGGGGRVTDSVVGAIAVTDGGASASVETGGQL